jgi:hypothetical protein
VAATAARLSSFPFLVIYLYPPLFISPPLVLGGNLATPENVLALF